MTRLPGVKAAVGESAADLPAVSGSTVAIPCTAVKTNLIDVQALGNANIPAARRIVQATATERVRKDRRLSVIV
jgi:hypothetical protein